MSDPVLTVTDLASTSANTDTTGRPNTTVRRVTITREHRANALTIELLTELVAIIDAAATDGVASMVLTGAGHRFSAGFDLDAVGHGVDADIAVDDAIGAAADALARAPFPVIAAVNGACMGAAIEVARACDVVAAHELASFALPATRLGLLYRPAALARLHRRIGGANARFLVVGGQRLDAAHAARIGLVDLVTSDLDATVTALCDSLAGSVPASVAATKALFADLDDLDSGRIGDGADLASHEEVRRRLLAAPERAAAVRDRQHDISKGQPS